MSQPTTPSKQPAFLRYLRGLSARRRTQRSNTHLAMILTVIAGTVNAGGFMAVGQYTSHMSGIVASMADNLVLGATQWVLAGLVSVLSFVAGAAVCAILVNYGRRNGYLSKYALPLFCEAMLVLLFGFMGAVLDVHKALFVPFTVILLCFIMGLQNALITKISNAVIRTTHITGMVTDFGIELGKYLYYNHSLLDASKVLADRQRMRLLLALVSGFFIGGVVGAWGFNRVGYLFVLPCAFVLILMAFMPIWDDIRIWWKRYQQKRIG